MIKTDINNGDIMYYLNNFFLFSILGHLFETIFYFIFDRGKKSGFLYLWWTPFYGLGSLICIFIFKIINKSIENKRMRNIVLFIIYFFIFSLFEYLGGILLEYLYGYAFWNYSNIVFHLGKYVSVFTSLLWVCFSFSYMFFIKKYTDKLVKRIPRFVSVFLLIIFIGDNILSLGKILFK